MQRGRIDHAIGVLATAQHGIVARRQLLALGIEGEAIRHRLECGRLHVVHRGVYAVGHRALTQRGRWMAAVLAAGPGAVLSHRSAAALWCLRPTSRRDVEVTVRGARRPRRGIQPHRGALDDDERTIVDGIPVTTVARTILDLAGVAPAHHVASAIHEAEVRGYADDAPLHLLLARYPRRPGAPKVRAVLAQGRIGLDRTRRELEVAFSAFVAAHALPPPARNRHIDVCGTLVEVDALWADRRLVVELDGRSTHATRAAFESDRAKDRRLAVGGYRVIRITWRQLHDEPAALAADLRRLLGL